MNDSKKDIETAGDLQAGMLLGYDFVEGSYMYNDTEGDLILVTSVKDCLLDPNEEPEEGEVEVRFKFYRAKFNSFKDSGRCIYDKSMPLDYINMKIIA